MRLACALILVAAACKGDDKPPSATRAPTAPRVEKPTGPPKRVEALLEQTLDAMTAGDRQALVELGGVPGPVTEVIRCAVAPDLAAADAGWVDATVHMKGRKAKVVSANLNVALGRKQAKGVANGCEYTEVVEYKGFDVKLELDGVPVEAPMSIYVAQIGDRYYLIGAMNVPRRTLTADEQAEIDRAVAVIEAANRRFADADAEARRAAFDKAPGQGGAPGVEELARELAAALRAKDAAKAGVLLATPEVVARAFDCPQRDLVTRLEDRRTRLGSLAVTDDDAVERSDYQTVAPGAEVTAGCTAKIALETETVKLGGLSIEGVNVEGRWYAVELR